VVAVLGAAVRARAYATALPVLAAHGLVPGPDGFAVVDLVAFAAARGWRVSAEPAARPTLLRRWRATVLRSSPPGTAGAPVAGTFAHGATEAEAVAVALASMLRREG
jgi:hypothetical protein